MSDATYFVTNKFVRTRNMLEAMALGRPVVTPMWLESCAQASCFIAEKKYILSDSKKEKEIGFNMHVSLARGCRHPLLQGRRVFITPNTKADRELLASLVKAAHGQVMGYFDTDVAEFVYSTKPSIDLLVNYLCNDLSKACSVKPPPVPKNWISEEPFIAKPTKDAEMEKMLRSMEGMPGAPNMKMYSREDLMNMNDVRGGEADDDDEDEGDDDKFPANLGKVLREKGTTANKDFKQKFLQGVKETRI